MTTVSPLASSLSLRAFVPTASSVPLVPFYSKQTLAACNKPVYVWDPEPCSTVLLHLHTGATSKSVLLPLLFVLCMNASNLHPEERSLPSLISWNI